MQTVHQMLERIKAGADLAQVAADNALTCEVLTMILTTPLALAVLGGLDE